MRGRLVVGGGGGGGGQGLLVSDGEGCVGWSRLEKLSLGRQEDLRGKKGGGEDAQG